MKTKTDILNEALKTVADRGASYGTVEENFNRIARLWNSHLVNAGILDDPRAISDPAGHNGITADDVAMMMALLKIARLELDPMHHDSWVDVAGYAACGGELAAKARNSS